MQARRASRELALILFSQFEKEISHYSRNDFENIMLKSVRILSNSASEELKLTVGSLIDIKSYLEEGIDVSQIEKFEILEVNSNDSDNQTAKIKVISIKK